jgi:hypothetical protein
MRPHGSPPEPSLIQGIHQLLSLGAIVFGLIASYYWFKASTAKVTEHPNRHNPGVEMTYDDKRSGQSIHVVATAMEQSRLNKIAAVHTAISVLCQALASALPRAAA